METFREKTALVIINPVSGKRGSNEKKIRSVLDYLQRLSYKLCVNKTKRKGEAKQIVKDYAKNATIILCCGGDGTLHEVINGLLDEKLKTPVYYFPCGTTNDMGKTLGLTNNAEDYIKVVRDGIFNEQDVAVFNDELFMIYTATFGLCSEVAYKTPHTLKSIFGYLAYWIYSIKSIKTFKRYRGRVWADDKKIEEDFLFGCVSNSLSVAGFIRLDREKVDLSDGRMDLLLIKYPENLISFLELVYEMMSKKYSEKHFIIAQAENFSFDLDAKTEWGLDGEYVGMFDRVNMKVLPKAYSILKNND